MIQEVAIDRDVDAVDRERGDAQPVKVGMAGRLARCPLAQEQDVGDDGRAFALEGIGRKANRPDKIGLGAQVLADGGILLVEGAVRRDHGQHAAGLQGVDGLGQEEVMQRQLLPVIVELEVGEGHVAYHRVDAVLGQLGVAEILDADVVFGVKKLCDSAGDRVQFDANEMRPTLPLAHEIADPTTRFQDGGTVRNAQAGDSLVDGGNDGRRRIEGVEGGALGAGVFLGREQKL